MKIERLVLGVLDIAHQVSDPVVADKYRDFTISWSRYDYRDEIIEATSVSEILGQAAGAGFRWCLIVPCGHVIAERWTPDHWQAQDFFSALQALVDRGDFLVAGEIIGDETTWFGFRHSCLLVNLEIYERLGAPDFEATGGPAMELTRADVRLKQGRIAELVPTAECESRQPTLAGWPLIAASLASGFPVIGFDESVRSGILDLSANCPDRTRAFASYLNHGIGRYRRDAANHDLGPDQIAFLNVVQPQTGGARNGVFLWNIEAYTDIETPAPEFKSPVTSLYSVAAGFKANRILYSHGWDPSTRIVYFDYSPNALEIRQYMVEHWDGADFPDFVSHLFRVFPHPATFYQLWADLTPDQVEPAEIRRMWQGELDRWGGARVFQDHWQACQSLRHEYVCCNILTDPAPLLKHMAEEPSALLWWSNAFFTMYGNWFYRLEERRHMYEHWIREIAERNPDLFLYGSDYNNVNVNSVRAAEYQQAYQRAGSNCLVPCRLSRTEIRM